MFIHAPTAFAIGCLLTLLLGGALLWLWWQDRSQRALATIGAAYILAAFGAVLLSCRGQIADRISIDIANALVTFSYGLVWNGMRQFEQRPVRPLAGILGAAIWLAACQVPAIYGSLAARVALMSGIVGIYSAAAAVELLRGRISRNLPSRRPLAGLLLVNALLQAARGPVLFMLPIQAQGSNLPLASPWFAFFSLAAIVVIVGIALILVALAKEQAEQRSVGALAAARDASERASAEKSRFLARMSHELRTLLNSVLGMAQLLARDPGLDPARREHAATLERAGRHLVAIVNDVLDLARVEAGRLELAPRPVDLRALLEETVALARPAAAAKEISLGLRVSPALPAAVLADPVRVRQILLNLLGNAVKFTPEGGKVTLSAGSGPGGLQLVVTDNGPGVPEDQRERLFHDYERMGADAAGTEGTGLGLAITAALARAMGGHASYEPGPEGEGSCFSVILPLPAAALPDAAPAKAPDPSLIDRPLRVLVVDDIAANRMVAQALLTQAGHRVQSCADGASAVRAIESGPLPDVVLMDVHMPGMDGFETTARIRALPGPAGRVPVLAVTAEAAAEEVRACLDSGMDGHVAKPIERERLLAAITRAVRVRV